MVVTLPSPDDLARRLGAEGDVARRALEAFGLAEYRAERLTRPELRRLLGLERVELDGFLKARGIDEAMTRPSSSATAGTWTAFSALPPEEASDVRDR